jgi:hypothetical protein
MVQGDLDNPESYAKYLDGVHGAFVNADCERSTPLHNTPLFWRFLRI